MPKWEMKSRRSGKDGEEGRKRLTRNGQPRRKRRRGVIKMRAKWIRRSSTGRKNRAKQDTEKSRRQIKATT